MAHLNLDYPYRPRQRPWDRSAAIQRLYGLIQASEGRAAELLDEFALLREHLASIRAHPEAKIDSGAPYWVNDFLPPLDAIAIYGLLARRNPRSYVEIGSGHSTRFARRAIADHKLRTRIISVDPHPRSEIDRLCDEVLRMPLEDIEPERFAELTNQDIFFIDGSHRSFQSSDVTVFFLEILPILPSGTVYGIHDVFLPADYPVPWEERFYNEQYLLACYLFGGADGDEILLPAGYITQRKELVARLDAVWSLPALQGIQRQGCAFWMRRGGDARS